MTDKTQRGAPMPTIPQSLLNLIGEYGMARTDRVGEIEILHRWDALIGGIKDYARSVAYAEPAQPQQDAPQLGGLTNMQIDNLADHHELYEIQDNGRVDRDVLRAFARAILVQAAPAQQATPVMDGWRPMPIEPTEEMLRSAERSMDRGDWIGAWYWRKGYAAMIAAAPQPGENG